MCRVCPFSDAKRLAPPSPYQRTTEGKRPIVIDLTDEEEETTVRRKSPPLRPGPSSGDGSQKISTPPRDLTREPGLKNISDSSSKTSTSRTKKTMKKGEYMTSSSG
jgi:hypothetical protein